MARKITDGNIRNKERTKLKLLDAVGEIIQTEGYTKLGINHIAQVAGVHKKLVYRYFGTVNNLIETYVRIKDYWLSLRYEADRILDAGKDDCGRAVAPKILENLMSYLNGSPEMQKIILWEISEKSKLMRVI
ncbi:transcriptional regulator, TetR family [bacterium A37T11]|nr:transcriptional regulator, TetR family [bacterium A37T11]